MRGDNAILALTHTVDEVTGNPVPLFSFPIQVCKATDEPGVKLDIVAPSGAAREQRYIDPETGEIVADEDCPRGIKVGDSLRPIDPDAWKAIGAQVKAKTATMLALGRVELTPEWWMRYGPRVTGRYFIQSPAKGGSPKAYKLAYEALLGKPKKGRTAATPHQGIVTKRCPQTKQALCVIYPDPSLRCLVLIQLAFADALREPDAAILAPQAAAVTEEMIEKARAVFAAMPNGDHALDIEIDEATAMRQELVDQALEGVEIVAPKASGTTEPTDNLEAMLAASIAAVTA